MMAKWTRASIAHTILNTITTKEAVQMKCFYHSADLDGHCSGAIVKYFYPECELIGINYGDEFPWHSIGRDEVVYMVDFGIQPFDGMIQLAATTPHFHWIDHHQTAIADYNAHEFKIHGLRRNGIGACQLVWEYLSPNGDVPYAVELLAQYDVWNHSNPETLPFQYGMRLEKTWPVENMPLWYNLFRNESAVQKIVEQGSIVLRYVSQDNEKYCNSCAFETELDGLRCIAVNKMLTNSQVFDSVWNPSKYDAMLTFGYRKGIWTVSLYTDKPGVDVSIIAKNRGGGGHKQAAGFQCLEIPFDM
jgi:oligoribonuclease NrnB/cAMP/cGMP phosphodiesterase (DHH superfamily)